MLTKLQEDIYSVLREAGIAIMEIYRSSDFNISLKSDNSPLTKADLLSDRIICDGLRSIDPSIEIITEESVDFDLMTAGLPSDCWIVDPLDGTKDFIARNNEFCICLARINRGIVTEGYIFSPVSTVLWYAKKNGGAWKSENGKLNMLKGTNDNSPYMILKSRSHLSDEDITWMKRISSLIPTKEESQGSALKFCRIAEGTGDLYLKSGIINKWDVAAGYLIVTESGGGILSVLSGEKLAFDTEGTGTDPFMAYSRRINDPELLLNLSPRRQPLY